MAKIPHEALHHIFRQRPDLFTRTMRRVLGEDYPDIQRVAELNCDLTEIKAIDREADTLLLTRTSEGDEILLIEPQTAIAAEKVRRWAWYICYLENKYELPVTLLIITPNGTTARWARQPLSLGPASRPSLRLLPHVLGPDNVEFITDADQAGEDVVYAVFAALTHRFDDNIEQALRPLAEALDGLDIETGTYWAEYVEGGLDGCARQLWKDIMMTMTYGYVSELRREGRVEGRVEATIDTLLIVIESHGLPLTVPERERITSCTDVDKLRTWTSRVAKAARVADIFGD